MPITEILKEYAIKTIKRHQNFDVVDIEGVKASFCIESDSVEESPKRLRLAQIEVDGKLYHICQRFNN